MEQYEIEIFNQVLANLFPDNYQELPTLCSAAVQGVVLSRESVLASFD